MLELPLAASDLLPVFDRHGVRFIVVGAVAAVVAGAPILTKDVDLPTKVPTKVPADFPGGGRVGAGDVRGRAMCQPNLRRKPGEVPSEFR